MSERIYLKASEGEAKSYLLKNIFVYGKSTAIKSGAYPLGLRRATGRPIPRTIGAPFFNFLEGFDQRINIMRGYPRRFLCDPIKTRIHHRVKECVFFLKFRRKQCLLLGGGKQVNSILYRIIPFTARLVKGWSGGHQRFLTKPLAISSSDAETRIP